jgi:hypothetical protein
MPPGLDPDDFVRSEGGPEAFRRLVEASRPMLDQFIQDAVQQAGIQGTVAALEMVAQMLVKVRNQTTRELYAGQLEGKLPGVTRQQVLRALRQAAEPRHAVPAAGAGPAVASAPAAASPATPLPPEELHFLVLLANFPELGRSADAARGGELLVHPATRQLFRGVSEQIALGGHLDIPAWLEPAPPGVRETVMKAMMDGSIAKVPDPAAAFSKLCAKLQLLRLNAEIAMNMRLQEEAQGRGDVDAVRAINVRGIELKRTKQGLEAARQRP